MPFHLQREHLLTEDTPSTPLVTELASWIWLASRTMPSRLTLPPRASIHTVAVFNLALSNAFLRRVLICDWRDAWQHTPSAHLMPYGSECWISLISPSGRRFPRRVVSAAYESSASQTRRRDTMNDWTVRRCYARLETALRKQHEKCAIARRAFRNVTHYEL
jgi:hypothetical protein